MLELKETKEGTEVISAGSSSRGRMFNLDEKAVSSRIEWAGPRAAFASMVQVRPAPIILGSISTRHILCVRNTTALAAR